MKLLYFFMLSFEYINSNPNEFAFSTVDYNSLKYKSHAICNISFNTLDNTHFSYGIKARQTFWYPRKILSTQEFTDYFIQQQCTENEVLSLHMLYQYDSFISFVRTLPEYKNYIQHLYKEICCMRLYEKCIRRFQNKHYFGFTNRIKELYEQMQQEVLKCKKVEPLFFCSEQTIINTLIDGETAIRIIVKEPGTSEIITAYSITISKEMI